MFLVPDASAPERVLELASLAEVLGLDLVTIQDHPYQARFLDTWTLLSVIAARTSTIRVAPNVANLPLRAPVVLARSVATLDVLSGGRVELGLGAGAFWDAIEAIGSPRRTPGESVDALAEAIDAIRAVWDTSERSIQLDGPFYPVKGAHPGPAPVHRPEIWLGAYKPRMLGLTGARADGWVPSMGYAEPDVLGRMSAAIDRAAIESGRSPVEIRRLYNLNGSFGSGRGFLKGAPGEWAEQLAGLTADSGISTFLLAVSDEQALRTFAREVAPAVRALVAERRERGEALGATPTGGPAAEHAAEAPASARASEAPAAERSGVAAAARPGVPAAVRAFDVEPTPDDGVRLAAALPWDESTRPGGPPREAGRAYSEQELAAGRHLIDVHDGLRAELERLRDVLEQVASGSTDPAALRTFFNRMTIRQNHWALGAFCESYCRAVTVHHTIEDESVFPHLERSDERLRAVIERLGSEHEQIAEMLDGIDEALVALVAGEQDALTRVRAAVDLVTDAMKSHFTYEERELIEPLARLGFY